MGYNISAVGPARDQKANLSYVRTDQRTDGPSGRQMDRPTDGWTDARTQGPIYLSRYNPMVKETHGIEHSCRCSSTGPNSQSERPDFGHGLITAEILPATSGEIENLPLEVTIRD